MMPVHELLLGGAKSGKSRVAEARAADWLAAAPDREALLLATALPGDAEMARRIARHQADRAQRVPALATVESPRALGAALARHAAPHRLLVVDCLTLWLTQCLLPLRPPGAASEVMDRAGWAAERDELLAALRASVSPVVLVSNEIGLGVMPMSPEARCAVDELGLLHQAVAAQCERVTLMVAGCEWPVKGSR